MNKKPKSPRRLELSSTTAEVHSDSDDDGKWIVVSGGYMDSPYEVQRLINFLTKAKEWLKRKR